MMDSLAMMIGYGVMGMVALPIVAVMGVFVVSAICMLIVQMIDAVDALSHWLWMKMRGPR